MLIPREATGDNSDQLAKEFLEFAFELPHGMFADSTDFLNYVVAVFVFCKDPRQNGPELPKDS